MKVHLFGLIAEKADADTLELDVASTAELRRALEARIPGMAGLIYAIAIDRRIDHSDRELSGSEEIAVMPPFAGG
jgi:molybdopterin converting factor small subunit